MPIPRGLNLSEVKERPRELPPGGKGDEIITAYGIELGPMMDRRLTGYLLSS